MKMLVHFLRGHDISVTFVQEVTHSILDNVWRYTVYSNLGNKASQDSIRSKGSPEASADNMFHVGQGHSGWGEWGMVGDHMYRLGRRDGGRGMNSTFRASVSHADKT
jgi:hypothetical protein